MANLPWGTAFEPLIEKLLVQTGTPVDFAIIMKTDLNFLPVLDEIEKGLVLAELMGLCDRKFDVIFFAFLRHSRTLPIANVALRDIYHYAQLLRCRVTCADFAKKAKGE
jgi:hypothetical protein